MPMKLADWATKFHERLKKIARLTITAAATQKNRRRLQPGAAVFRMAQRPGPFTACPQEAKGRDEKAGARRRGRLDCQAQPGHTARRGFATPQVVRCGQAARRFSHAPYHGLAFGRAGFQQAHEGGHQLMGQHRLIGFFVIALAI